MTGAVLAATPLGGRVFDHQVEVTESWSIDVRGVPAMPDMPLRASYSKGHVHGPILDIVVRRTTVGRSAHISITLLGAEHDDPRDRRSVEFGSGARFRLAILPTAFCRIIAEQTGVRW